MLSFKSNLLRDHFYDHKCVGIQIVYNDRVTSPPGAMLEECRTPLTIIWLMISALDFKSDHCHGEHA